MPSDLLPRASTLVTERERERAVDMLTSCFAAGGLSEAELEARLERAQRAASRAELERVVADLPNVAPLTTPPPKVRALLSGHHGKIVGRVAAALTVRARAGYVELDLTEATFEPGVTEIDVRVFAGYVQIRLPANVRIASEGGALLGYFSVLGGSESSGDESVVRVTGRAVLGFVECLVGSRKPPELPPGS